MWIFTTVGFFSVVQKRGQGSDQLMVRARFKGDLEALKEAYLPELGAVTEQGGTDYAYRAPVAKIAFARAMARIVADLTYSNFKSEVAAEQGHEREQLYHRVWNVMIQAQEKANPRARQGRMDTLMREHGFDQGRKQRGGRGRQQAPSSAQYDDEQDRWGERIHIRGPEERRAPRSSMRYVRGPDGFLRAVTHEDEAYRYEEFDYLRDLPEDNG